MFSLQFFRQKKYSVSRGSKKVFLWKKKLLVHVRVNIECDPRLEKGLARLIYIV